MQLATSQIDIKESIKRQNQVSTTWLVYYRERKREHDDQRQELQGTGKKHENVSGGRTGPGNPTEALIIRLDEHDRNNTARWLQTVEDVKNIIGPKKRQ